MALALVTPPEDEPVSLAEAKAALRVDHDFEDDLIGFLITAARELVEERTARQLMPAGWRLCLDAFPCGAIEIRKAPVAEVTGVTAIDPDGDSLTLDEDDYLADLVSAPARLLPAIGTAWPATQCGRPNAVSVDFDAGYANAAAVPAKARQAILLLVGHWYERREAVGSVGPEIALAFDALTDSLKWTALADAAGEDD